MALYDSADLLAAVVRDSGIPSSVSFPASTDWYAWLTQAQAFWLPELAGEYPYHMLTPPTLLVTSDGGVTYQFPGETAPLAVEIYASLTGPRLIVGQFDDTGADYVWEGSQIRMPVNQIQSFQSGAPYGRWVASPNIISATQQPSMLPVYARALLIPRALILWATRGGRRDPKPFRDRETEVWSQVQKSLKQSNPFIGDVANRQSGRVGGIGFLMMRARY